jgi:hypothetical protein
MPRRRFTPSPNLLEQRLALSTLSTPAYLGAKAALGQALADLRRTGDLPRASAAVARAAARIPLSGPALLPLWESELATVSRKEPRSALQARRDVFLALDVHLHRGVESGAIAVRGPASRQVSRPAVRALDGYAAFSNNSSQTLVLTVGRDGNVVFRQQVGRGATLHFKPPGEDRGFPIRPVVFTVAVSTIDGPASRGFEVRGLAGTIIVATDGPVRGEIELRVFREDF